MVFSRSITNSSNRGKKKSIEIVENNNNNNDDHKNGEIADAKDRKKSLDAKSLDIESQEGSVPRPGSACSQGSITLSAEDMQMQIFDQIDQIEQMGYQQARGRDTRRSSNKSISIVEKLFRSDEDQITEKTEKDILGGDSNGLNLKGLILPITVILIAVGATAYSFFWEE